MSRAVNRKSGRFEDKWAKMDLAPAAMRGRAYLQNAEMVVMSVRPELAITGKLHNRTSLAPFG